MPDAALEKAMDAPIDHWTVDAVAPDTVYIEDDCGAKLRVRSLVPVN